MLRITFDGLYWKKVYAIQFMFDNNSLVISSWKIHRTNYLFCFINKANYIRLTAIHWWEKRILVRNRKNSNTTSEKWNWALKCLQRNRRKKCVCARGKCPNEWKMYLWKKGDTRHQAVQRVLTIWHFVHVYTSTIVAVSSSYRYIYIFIMYFR